MVLFLAARALADDAPLTPAPPEHLGAYMAELESPDRAKWQKPREVVNALGLKQGMTIADIGAGTGYFTRRFAPRVGPQGTIYALDTEQGMLDDLHRRAPGFKNIVRRVVAPDDPKLGDATIDLIFICNTGHHLPDRVHYYEKLRQALRPGGRLVLIDFQKKKLPVGPPLNEKVSREETLEEAKKAGFKLRRSRDFLPYQYFLELEAKG